MSEKHPLPYRVFCSRDTGQNWYLVVDANNVQVFETTDESTALEIVAAVNSHKKLVDALKDATSLYDYARADTAYSREKMRQFREVLSEGGAQ